MRDVASGEFYTVSGKEHTDAYMFRNRYDGTHAFSCTLTEWEGGVRDDIILKKRSYPIFVDVELPEDLRVLPNRLKHLEKKV